MEKRKLLEFRDAARAMSSSYSSQKLLEAPHTSPPCSRAKLLSEEVHDQPVPEVPSAEGRERRARLDGGLPQAVAPLLELGPVGADVPASRVLVHRQRHAHQEGLLAVPARAGRHGGPAAPTTPPPPCQGPGGAVSYFWEAVGVSVWVCA